MFYALETGPHEATIIRNCIRENKPYPPVIANAPELTLDAAFYYLAYQDLASCRNYEGGPIPYTAINAYAVENEMTLDDMEILKDVVRGVDHWFADYVKAKGDKEKAKDKTKTTRRGRRGRL